MSSTRAEKVLLSQQAKVCTFEHSSHGSQPYHHALQWGGSMNSPYGLPTEYLNCHLRSDNFFCSLFQESLKAFNQIKHSTVFPEGTAIFVQGQTPRGIFTLCQGQAKLSTNSHDGKTLILRIVKPGEVLGLDAIVTGNPYELTAETMQPSQQPLSTEKTSLASSKSTAMPVCALLSISAVTVTMHTTWSVQSGCQIRSPRESRNFCLNRRRTGPSRMEQFAQRFR